VANDQVLTRDNTLLSQPNLDDGNARNDDRELVTDARETAFAVNCKSDASEAVCAYVEVGIAPATRRAYKADLEHFRDWGDNIPTTDIQLASYLAQQAPILTLQH
jgi:hypothetical protein